MSEEKIPLKGILVFYINVGHLAPFRAEAFIERMKDKFKQDCFAENQVLPPDVGILWVPTRTVPTEVSYVAFEAADERKVQILTDMMQEWEDEWDEHLEEAEEEQEEKRKAEDADFKTKYLGGTLWEKLLFWK
jgi:hypothetical protein